MQPSHAKNPALAAKIAQLSLPLAPLVSLPTGKIHPSFPKNLLGFWLLTTEELDSIAHFYHQRTPGPWTYHYPCPVRWDREASLEEKRMKIGKFIGLRVIEADEGSSEPLPIERLTDEELTEMIRCEREKKAEEESQRSKGKWY